MTDLHGLRILNTRPIGQNEALSVAIKQAGGIAVECPALAIEPTFFNENCPAELLHLTNFNKAIFVSANAVEYFFRTLQRFHITWQKRIEVIAVGGATMTKLQHHGVDITERPIETGSESLLRLESLQQVENQKILLVKGESGRELIRTELALRGATVFPFVVYRRCLPQLDKEFVRSIWHCDAVDVIVFTSEESIRNLLTIFGEEASEWLRSKPCWVISPRLADLALSYGIKQVYHCSYENLLESIQNSRNIT